MMMMAGTSSALLLLVATILVVRSHPVVEDELGVPAAVTVREKRNTDCYYNHHQADGAVYYKTCTSFCFAYGKHPYCYNGQCTCTSTPGQLPTFPRYQPQPEVSTPPPPPKRSVYPWDVQKTPQFSIPTFGQGQPDCL